jgi:hypothetical protein
VMKATTDSRLVDSLTLGELVLPVVDEVVAPLLGHNVDFAYRGAMFQLVAPTSPHSPYHMILNLVSGAGHSKDSCADVAAGAALAVILARRLSKYLYGDEHHYTISKNGSATGSVPEIEHWHIYGFKDRAEKIATFAKNLTKFGVLPPHSAGDA